MNSRALLFCLALSASMIGCGDDTDTQSDGHIDDFGTQPIDSGADSGAVDGGELDGGELDGGADAGIEDSGVIDDAGVADAGGFTPPDYGRWIKYEPEGAVCSNGTPYKFFVNFSQTSDNVIIFLQGGGACWDYASCTGTGIRSAANPNGIPDNYATNHTDVGGLGVSVDLVYPLLNNRADVSPMADWNKVFVPYCTGDVYSGDTTVTYDDPDGLEPSVTFNHTGHRNIMAMIGMLTDMFPSIPKMFVGGCSAGGIGALNNYYFFRTELEPDQGYLLDDSGPLFPSQEATSRSLPLQNRVRQAWNVDPLIASMPQASTVMQDFGNLPTVLASEFPNDRLATTFFRLDYNYSLYSYERFYEVDAETRDIVEFGDGTGLGGLGLDEDDPLDRAAVHSLWWDDTDLMRTQFDGVDNLAYYLPFYRDTNSSHCVTIPGFEEFPSNQLIDLILNDLNGLAWAGSDITTSSGTINIKGYVEHLLDDSSQLQSHFEEDSEGRFLSCAPSDYDSMMCSAAVMQ